jgi:hypothetical protein
MKEEREDFVVSELGGWKTISQERWQNYSCLDPWFIPINFDAEMKCSALSQYAGIPTAKLSICLNRLHATKAWKGVEVYLLAFLETSGQFHSSAISNPIKYGL